VFIVHGPLFIVIGWPDEEGIERKTMNYGQRAMKDEQRSTQKSGRRSLFRFRQWPVYQAAKSFRKEIRELARKLPENERYLLRDQISRAADSICLNIADGSNVLVGGMKKSEREVVESIFIQGRNAFSALGLRLPSSVWEVDPIF